MAIDDKKHVGSFDDTSTPGVGNVDESGPLDVADPEAQQRRRRKRGALRVPSDNVPRPQGSPASGAPVDPDASVPEPITSDPRIAGDPAAPVVAKRRADTDQELAVDVDFHEDNEDTEVTTNPMNVAARQAGDVNGKTRGSGASTSPLGGAAAVTPSASAEADDTFPTPGDEEVLGDDDLVEDAARAAEEAADKMAEDKAAAAGATADDEEELSAAELEEVASGPSQQRDQAAPVPVATTTSAARSTPVAAAAPAPPPPPAAAKSPPAARSPRAAEAAAAAAAAAAEQTKPRKRKGKAWFEEIFDDDYLRTLPFLTPQATQREAAFLVDGLGLMAGQQVLDLGCGYGRHAMELAARGHHVVALDLSLPLLIRGADEAQRRGLNINFVHGDMRELTFDAQFDGAYCVFSTFGYFDDETNKRVAMNVARALKTGGRFVVEVLNRDYIVSDLPTRVWWEGDGCVVLEEVDFNYYASRIVSNRSVVFEDGRQLEQEISIRAYSLHELGKLLHQAGFRVTEISGNLATRGHFFGSHSQKLIVIAEKRAPDAGREPSQPTELPSGTSGK